jgi:spore coat protein U-like protein
MRQLSLSIAAAALVLAAAGDAMAATGTDTGSFEVKATVVAKCRFKSATDLSFGSYDPTDATDNTSGQNDIVVKCTKGTPYTIALDQGANADAGSTAAAPTRRMKSGSEYLSYSLYSDSGRSTVWGDNANNPGMTSTTNADTTYNAYGTLPAGQDVTAGLSFTDTVGVTVTF